MFLKLFFSSVLFFCFFSNLALAATLKNITIQGRVAAASNNANIRNAAVSFYSAANTLLSSAITNSKGQYAASFKYQGRLTIKAVASGYKTQTKIIDVKSGKGYVINFALIKNNPPVLRPIGSKSVKEGGTLRFTIYAADSDHDTLQYSALNLPQGASFNASTRVFMWRPNYNQAGKYTVTFIVSDGSVSDSEKVTIAVSNVDIAPPAGTILINNNDQYVYSSAVILTLSAQDSESGVATMRFSNDGITWSSPELYSNTKVWMLIGDYGEKIVYVKFSDKAGNWSQPFSDSIVFARIPIILTARIACDNKYTLYINGRGVGTGDNWGIAQTYVSEINPGENVIAIEGINEGGPASVIADFSVNNGVIITDSSWKSSVTLQAGWNNIAFDDTSWTQGHVWHNYGGGPWGQISGIDGTYAKWIWYRDDANDPIAYFRKRFNGSDLPPAIDMVGDKIARTGALLEFDIMARHPDNKPLVYYADNLPTGSNFDPATQHFSWRPDYSQIGSYPNICFYVTDGIFTDAKNLKIDVIPGVKINNVSTNSSSFNPQNGETMSILYSLDMPADVTIKIYDLYNNLRRTLLNVAPRETGAHTEIWDGKDDAGAIVPPDGYTFTIEAAATDGGNGYFTPCPGGALNSVSLTDLTITDYVNVYNNQPCRISYNLAQNAMVSIRVGEDVDAYGANWPVVDWQLRPKGANVDYWNGRDNDGNIIPLERVVLAFWTLNLAENAMLVVADRPTTPIVASDPYMILPCYGEFSAIRYTLATTCKVSLSICSADGATTIKNLLDNVERPAGEYTITWDGKDENGRLYSGEGNLRIKIVVEPTTPNSQTVLGNITIY